MEAKYIIVLGETDHIIFHPDLKHSEVTAGRTVEAAGRCIVSCQGKFTYFNCEKLVDSLNSCQKVDS